MDRHDLTDREWEAIRKFLPKERPGKPGRPWCSHRQVINGVLWILAVGAPWRDLPESYGNWSTVYKRFCRWRKSKLWERMFESLLKRVDRHCGIDDSLWCVDESVVRAHRCAAGATTKEPEEPEKHALGRSQGGYSTKVHLLTSGCGLPLAFVLTPGQGVSQPSFYAWRRKLRERKNNGSHPRGARRPKDAPDQERMFVPLELLGAAQSLEIIHPLGYRVQIDGEVNPVSLRQVIQVLDERGAR